jgi:hypothetical protein
VVKVRHQMSRQRALIKNKIKFSSKIRIFRMEQLQSHILLTASSYMGKYLRISSYIRKPCLVHDFATAPLKISLYIKKMLFSFLSVCWHVIKGCHSSRINVLSNATCTDKKDNQIFLIYKENQSGAAAKSYMRKGFLTYEEMHKYFPI